MQFRKETAHSQKEGKKKNKQHKYIEGITSSFASFISIQDREFI